MSIHRSDRFWAKQRGSGGYHPLVAHSADVAAVMRVLVAPGSVIADRLARAAGRSDLTTAHRAALVYLAALHDLGKANHGFQAKLRRAAGVPASSRRWPADGHLMPVLQAMDYPPLALALERAFGRITRDPKAAFDWFVTTLFHHGRPGRVDAVPEARFHALWEPDPECGRDPVAMVERMTELAAAWTGLDELEGVAPLPFTAQFTHLFAGVLVLADWIGSTETVFKFAPGADDDPDRYWETAQCLADTACVQIGVVPARRVVALLGTNVYERLWPGIFGRPGVRPTPLQRAVATMELPEPGTRILIESETGSGKTEAALTLYARLRAEGRVGGLFFALPSRATAAAMYRRVAEAVANLYATTDAPLPALAMGGDDARTRGREILESLGALTFPDPEDDPVVHWASDGAKKYLSAEIAVGTVDQALLAALCVRHAHLRLAPLSRHLLVIDELHAYDRYMGEVLERLLDVHGRVGGIAVLMSATLADIERQRYGGLEEPSMENHAVARPYPLVSICRWPGGGWREIAVAAAGRPKHVRWGTGSEEGGVREAVDAARAGARVCILRNTVADARRTVRLLRESGAADLLWRPVGIEHTPAYHSRYTPDDRGALDAAALGRFGRDGPAGGVILVSTQVVEQSLDVDFDFMVTDLAPVDVLLQRVGRLHRHGRTDRPAEHRDPRLRVIAPAGGYAELLDGGRKPHGWGSVYPSLGDLELTYRLVASVQRIEIPADNRALIEAVYHPDRQDQLRYEPAPLGALWSDHLDRYAGVRIGQRIHAGDQCIRFDAAYCDPDNVQRFDAPRERSIRTRIGDDRVRVVLARPVACVYAPGKHCDHVDVPILVAARALEVAGAGEDLCAEVIEIDGEVARYDLAGRELRYDQDGWWWSGSAGSD